MNNASHLILGTAVVCDSFNELCVLQFVLCGH